VHDLVGGGSCHGGRECPRHGVHVDHRIYDPGLGAGLGSNQILDVDMTPAGTGDNIFAELWVGPQGGSLTKVEGPVAVGGGFAGFVVATGSTTVNFNPSTTLDFEINAWDADTGSDFASAMNRGSANGTVTTVDVTATPNATTGFGVLQLEVVPEPSTIALGIIGGLALLLRRRK